MRHLGARACLLCFVLALGLLAACIAPPETRRASPPSVSPPSATPARPQPQPSGTGDFIPTRNVEYGKGGEVPLLLDMYAPKTPVTTPAPAIVWIHGGAWRTGDKFPSQVAAMARRGFFAVSINYRLSGVAPFPAAVEDAKCAIRWLRANAARYAVDPERIGVWGGSAGGHLALMVACADESAGLEGNGGWPGVSSRAKAACSFYGPSDLTALAGPYGRLSRDNELVQFLGFTPQENPEMYRRASPVAYVSKGDPPLLLVHGTEDRTVPPRQSELMFDAYQNAGLEAALIKVEGAGHGFQQPPSITIKPSAQEIEQAVADFFLKHLAGR